MSTPLTIDADNSFLGRARYPKGKARLKAILEATYDIVISEGLAAASQEAIARRANVTQSAVRHYFPTKEELLLAFFSVGVERLKAVVDEKLAAHHDSAREKLLDIVSTHYDWINHTEDVYYFESAAFWGRNPGFRSMREAWYQKLTRHYRELLQEIHPDWNNPACQATAFQIVTLVLGSWTTMGNTRPMYRSSSKQALKATLMAGIDKLIT